MKRFIPFLILAVSLICASPPALAQGGGAVHGSLTSGSTACITTGSSPNCLVFKANSAIGGIGFSTGATTFSGTVQFEIAFDPAGAIFTAMAVTPSGGGAAVTSATTNSGWTGQCAGCTAVRMRVSTYSSGTLVASIQPSTVAYIAPSSGGGAPSGSAGGDLSGTYPNPGVAKVNGTSLAGLSTGILRNTTSTGVPSSAELTGDATTSGSNAVTVVKVNGASVPASALVVGTNSSSQPVAATADSLSGVASCVAASNSGSAYTCSTSPTFVPAAKDMVLFKADVANTGTATLAVNSASAATIKKQGTGANLAANDLTIGMWTLMVYDGTNWQMLGQVANAAAGGAPAPWLWAAAINNTGGAGCTVTTTAIAGNHLIVEANSNSPGNTFTTPTDGHNTYTSIVPITTQSPTTVQVWEADNIAAGAQTIVTAFSSGIDNGGCAVLQFNDNSIASALDQYAATLNTATTTPTGGPTAATSQANEMVAAFVVGNASASSITPGTGFLQAATANPGGAFNGAETKVVFATGAQSAGFTLGGSVPSIAIVLALK